MGIGLKRISSILLITVFVIGFSFTDNNLFAGSKAYAETIENVTINIVKDINNTSKNVLLSKKIEKGQKYELPCDKDVYFDSDITYIVIGYKDQGGQFFKCGSEVDTSEIDNEAYYEPVCVEAVYLTIINPVTKKSYDQKVVKNKKIDSSEKVKGINIGSKTVVDDSEMTVSDINKDILAYSGRYSDFEKAVNDIKDEDSTSIKDKLQLDNPMFVYKYYDGTDRNEELKSSINEIEFKYDSKFVFNYYANVTVKDQEGKTVSEEEQYKVPYLDNLSEIKFKPEEGKEFKNWVTDSKNLVKEDNGTWTLESVAENTELVANLSEKKTYSFTDNEGNEILSKYKGTIGKGGSVTLPLFESDDIKEITPEGKKIICFKDQNGNEYTDTVYNLQDNIVLVPQFGSKVCLSYETDENKSLHDVGIGQNVKLVNGPQKPQVSFKCWRDSDGNDYNAGDTIKIKGDINLKAVYEAKITYINSDATVLCEKNFEIGQNITYPEPPESNDISQTFYMWYPTIHTAEKNTQIKAQYKKKEFIVSYDVLEGMTETVKYGEDAQITNIIPEKNGYTFKGWSSDGKNITQDTLIKAIFEINKYTVSFDGKVQIVAYGEDAIEPEPPAKEGYIFSGWSKPSKNVCSNLEIVSEFVPIQCKVTVNGDVQYVEYGKDAIMPEKAPEKEGYVFKEWSQDGKNITKDTEINPIFEIAKYKVIVNGEVQYVEYGKDAIMPESIPQKEGYTFKGWTNDGKNIKSDTIIEPIFEKSEQNNIPSGKDENHNTADKNNFSIFVVLCTVSIYVIKNRKTI